MDKNHNLDVKNYPGRTVYSLFIGNFKQYK